jgi:hypothetical protein
VWHIQQQIRLPGYEVAYHLGPKVRERTPEVGNLSDPLGGKANGVEAVKEHLEVDLNRFCTWVHSYVCDTAYRHTSVSNGA